ncbi:c-type cytochrome [Fluviispira vulneris]|uniref:c-type cytochrome n=1 Tax=Fluviispira vulneris TaxID=2763012 RepID=UPI001644C38E|nr:c-type cytochrome [Fluviispira vulneris]
MKIVMINIFSIFLLLVSFQATSKDGKVNPALTQGEKLYVDNCKMCHGSNGDGNGPVGKNLAPKPKHLKAYSAKQIIKILTDGNVSMMAHFKESLSQSQKEAIAQYCEKTFSDK